MPTPASWLSSILTIQPGTIDGLGGDNGTISAPVGAAVGDLLIVFAFGMVDGINAQNPFISTTSTGWSPSAGDLHSARNNVVCSRWSKIATSGDLSGGFSFRAGFSDIDGTLYVAGVMYALAGTISTDGGNDYIRPGFAGTSDTISISDSGLVSRMFFNALLVNSASAYSTTFTSTDATMSVDVSDTAAGAVQHWELYGYRWHTLVTPTPSLLVTRTASSFIDQAGDEFGNPRRGRTWCFVFGV